MVRRMASTGRAFRYLREPLCVAAAVGYAANKLLLKPLVAVGREAPDASAGFGADFVRGYLGDTLCLPVCIPLTLWLLRLVGARAGDAAPTLREVVLLWAWWSCCFEWIGPRLTLLAPGAVSDPWDVLAYAVGGAVAALCWCHPRAKAPGAAVSPSSWAPLWLAASLVAVGVLAAYRLAALW